MMLKSALGTSLRFITLWGCSLSVQQRSACAGTAQPSVGHHRCSRWQLPRKVFPLCDEVHIIEHDRALCSVLGAFPRQEALMTKLPNSSNLPHPRTVYWTVLVAILGLLL